MGLNKLDQLYRAVIMDHAQHPRNNQPLEHYTHQTELLNPTCGDAIIVQCLIEEGCVKEVGFTGYGCSISMASASMMTQAMKGQTLEKAQQLINQFNEMIGGSPHEQGTLLDLIQRQALEEDLQDAALLEGVKKFPARYKCAILAWKALEVAVRQDQSSGIDGLTIGQNTQTSQESEGSR
ncbi:Fe-S cluster assembly sulfur transfer protein SufU [Vaginisenegalia massiliensis]|uniref:Fe-S cluster assembly sulfur transfer protein SufU n=1 Tax=Vaginisenegalia massiliensis TaxID=2058294 RepID=UPI000F53251C|nr:SUF system NifU family Fe-S cluster assembly protein [Vaginisenegalia massiliensis]